MRKLLPTCAPKPVAPEFLDKFAKHGWQRVERIWGKPTVAVWRKVIGAERMDECRKRFLEEQKHADPTTHQPPKRAPIGDTP